eukprot:6191963-Pleurochrysis_carterae.AAC.2
MRRMTYKRIRNIENKHFEQVRRLLAQLEKLGLVKNLGKAVGNLVARADELRLDRAVGATTCYTSAVLNPFSVCAY